MKLEIMGFSQQGLIDLGLNNDDAVLLRWFIDFQGTQRMKAVPNPEDGKVYFWVNFKKLCEDLPIITKSDRWMSERFSRLVNVGLLERFTSVGPLGRFSAFRISDSNQYMKLITTDPKTSESMSVNTEAMSVKTDMVDVNTDRAMSAATDMQSNLNRLPSNNNTGDSLQADNYDSPEPSKIEAPSQSPAVFQLPLNDSSNYEITEEQIKTWSGLYPAVDVMQELRNMYGWLDGNPSRRKTRNGVKRFINSWLSREQDRGIRKASKAMVRTPVSNDAFEGQGGEYVW